MASLISLVEGSNVVVDCRQKEKQESLLDLRPRIGAEIILADGTRRYFRCRSRKFQPALSEVLVFVESIENATGEKVMWRFKGEKTYHMGSNCPAEFSRKEKIRRGVYKLLNEFFDLD